MMNHESEPNIISITIHNSSDCYINIKRPRAELESEYTKSFYEDIYELVKNHKGETINETSDKLYTDIWLYSLETNK